MTQRKFQTHLRQHIDLENADAVRLALASAVPKAVIDQIKQLRSGIETHKLKLSTEYGGSKFVV